MRFPFRFSQSLTIINMGRLKGKENHNLSTKPSNATPISLEPLTRRNIEGKVYKRNSAVEQQLIEVLPLSDELIVLQARIDDKATDGYLLKEALVFLIRTSHQKNNYFLCNEISRILLIRCKDQVVYRIRAIRCELLIG